MDHFVDAEVGGDGDRIHDDLLEGLAVVLELVALVFELHGRGRLADVVALAADVAVEIAVLVQIRADYGGGGEQQQQQSSGEARERRLLHGRSMGFVGKMLRTCDGSTAKKVEGQKTPKINHEEVKE